MKNVHVAISNVSKTFGKAKVLDDISLEIPRGSFTTLLGPSGCGKTTLLRTLAGFYSVELGDIFIDDQRVNDVPSHLRNAIMVFQDYALFPHMNIRENITYGLRIRKMPQAEIGKRLERTIGYLDIGNLLDRTPGQISGGQQQRVALARALVMEPEVLLLDEPLSNLDAKLRISIRAELRQLQQRLKITTIYVTHDQAEALAMSDMIAVMKDGHIMQVGSPSDVYYHPNSTFVASFIGTVNFIRGVVRSVADDRIEVEVKNGGATIAVQEKPQGTDAGNAPRIGDNVTLAIRPESIKLLDKAAAGDDSQNFFNGKLIRSIFEGSSIRYWIDAFGAEILADVFDPGENIVREDIVRFTIEPGKVHIIIDRCESGIHGVA
ncbi:MAG: ABC transporter ATP-binding protein [Spirochaetales bacterium]|jgi:ABC-type Fe3+/spermidine/putrescine transport system ATPase subunit